MFWRICQMDPDYKKCSPPKDWRYKIIEICSYTCTMYIRLHVSAILTESLTQVRHTGRIDRSHSKRLSNVSMTYTLVQIEIRSVKEPKWLLKCLNQSRMTLIFWCQCLRQRQMTLIYQCLDPRQRYIKCPLNVVKYQVLLGALWDVQYAFVVCFFFFSTCWTCSAFSLKSVSILSCYWYWCINGYWKLKHFSSKLW